MEQAIRVAEWRRLIGTGKKVRVFLKGWFTPLHGEVVDYKANQIKVGERWITLRGPKCDVYSIEVIR